MLNNIIKVLGYIVFFLFVSLWLFWNKAFLELNIKDIIMISLICIIVITRNNKIN